MPPIQSPSFANSPKQRQFTDREEPQQLFCEALDNATQAGLQYPSVSWGGSKHWRYKNERI